MNSAELLRKLKRLAKQRGVDLTIQAGKGSHRKVQFDERRTIVPTHGTELKIGTLNGILRDLGISKEEL
jgi:predicted RNA binding protein YcfA (HicA-like mRNA interferase family)